MPMLKPWQHRPTNVWKRLGAKARWKGSTSTTKWRSYPTLPRMRQRGAPPVAVVYALPGEELKEWAAARKHDVASMRAAADAVRKGDAKELRGARVALWKTLELLSRGLGGSPIFYSWALLFSSGIAPIALRNASKAAAKWRVLFDLPRHM